MCQKIILTSVPNEVREPSIEPSMTDLTKFKNTQMQGKNEVKLQMDIRKYLRELSKKSYF
jgi:hypothetical protein